MSILLFLLPAIALSHCGPDDVLSELSEGVADYLAGDILQVADRSFQSAMEEQPKLNASIMDDNIKIGTNMSMTYEERIEAMTKSMCSRRNVTKPTKHLIFMATHNVHRGEHWFRDFTLLQLDPVVMLKKLMSTPWNEELTWKNSTVEEKKARLNQIIRDDLCRS